MTLTDKVEQFGWLVVGVISLLITAFFSYGLVIKLPTGDWPLCLWCLSVAIFGVAFAGMCAVNIRAKQHSSRVANGTFETAMFKTKLAANISLITLILGVSDSLYPGLWIVSQVAALATVIFAVQAWRVKPVGIPQSVIQFLDGLNQHFNGLN